MDIFNISDFVDRRRLDGPLTVFHSIFFHGYIKNLANCDSKYGARQDKHQAIKNVFHMAPIIMPGLELIFREDLFRNSESIRGALFSPTSFEKIFSFPFYPGDFSYITLPGYPDVESMLDALTNEDHLASTIPKYFRCKIPRLQDVNNFSSGNEFYKVDSSSSPYSAENISLNPRLFERFSLLWYTHGVLASEEFLEEFGIHFDPRYFEITKVRRAK